MVRLRLPDPANRDMKYLASQEQLVSMVRLHWAVLLRVVAETVGAVVLALAVNIFLSVRGDGASLVTTLLWYIALFMILRALWRITEWHMDHLMITDKRLVKVSGVFVRQAKTMPLKAITDMTYTRDPLGRVLGYGEFNVESAGQDQALKKLPYIPKPDQVYITLLDMTFMESPKPADG
ncbi:PH domain-containing protein [Frankia sp. AgB1.9]|uniref:Membrane-flanked domain protein n=1 Tax=Pseudofrankia inefficax (strain DSM 45817 / CECT 9037 / DDB 130130 / EuI1c) TaxID=298654 RepID=E3IXU9_PSEI1|nr:MULTISPECIES: PH domain-containing protein [Frankiaceae]ADP80258.1 membrane-flanked domain protein [Pseudofrankia inefficax]MBL7487012.1 PH domain-containing protein [Frankia sp. AgW1.1]MBL7552038.1 PH domain-containing protein [Frankia sp. AgB1.9]MBL7623357.1 PH domain-containing protein [Frankia sp. AgB1.8]